MVWSLIVGLDIVMFVEAELELPSVDVLVVDEAAAIQDETVVEDEIVEEMMGKPVDVRTLVDNPDETVGPLVDDSAEKTVKVWVFNEFVVVLVYESVALLPKISVVDEPLVLLVLLLETSDVVKLVVPLVCTSVLLPDTSVDDKSLLRLVVKSDEPIVGE